MEQRPRLESFSIRSETRLLSLGITALPGVCLYSERNEAVEPWDNGLVSFGIKRKSKRGRYPMT